MLSYSTEVKLKTQEIKDGCLKIFCFKNLEKMHAGGGNAWMKIMGIGDHGGKKKKEKYEKG